MSYLIASDYKKQIQADNLNQIIGSDTSILSASELAAQEEITSYLTQKYDLSQEFKDLFAWSPTKVYNASDRVYLDATAYNATATYALNSLCLNAGNVYICTTAITIAEPFNAAKWALLGTQYSIYFAQYPKQLFDYTNTYTPNDQVFWKNKVYTALKGSVFQSKSGAIQYDSYSEIPIQNIFPDNPNIGTQWWGVGTAYSIAAGTLPTNTASWTLGDNRSQQMVMVMIDIALYHVHSRISPRNIPDLRVKRYDEARSWLKSAGKGDITANLALIQIHTGNRIRFGGNVKLNNRY